MHCLRSSSRFSKVSGQSYSIDYDREDSFHVCPFDDDDRYYEDHFVYRSHRDRGQPLSPPRDPYYDHGDHLQPRLSHHHLEFISRGWGSRNLLKTGTRQGCPLSPLLFVMVLEILLRTVQNDSEIQGIRHRGFQYKYRAFADDILFIIEESKTTMPKLLNRIEEFGRLAGFYINKQKSKVICKNMDKKQQKELEETTKIENVKKIKYLGIQITGKRLNYFRITILRHGKKLKRIWKNGEI